MSGTEEWEKGRCERERDCGLETTKVTEATKNVVSRSSCSWWFLVVFDLSLDVRDRGVGERKMRERKMADRQRKTKKLREGPLSSYHRAPLGQAQRGRLRFAKRNGIGNGHGLAPSDLLTFPTPRFWLWPPCSGAYLFLPILAPSLARRAFIPWPSHGFAASQPRSLAGASGFHPLAIAWLAASQPRSLAGATGFHLWPSHGFAASQPRSLAGASGFHPWPSHGFAASQPRSLAGATGFHPWPSHGFAPSQPRSLAGATGVALLDAAARDTMPSLACWRP